MANLQGKIALITGAKGALGTSVTSAYLQAGARVIGVSRSIQASDFPHPNFTAMPADLAIGDAARKLAAGVVAQFGRIDALVHVTGGFAGGQSVADLDDATLDQMFEVNFRSAFHILRAVIPTMRAQKAGRIVVVASRQGVEPTAMLGAYNASKAAVVSLVKTVALENKDAGITANSVLPGAMATPANQGANLIDTAQVASLLTYLASDEAGAITGAAIPVYGTQL
ncbi:MAG TPA: SDR family NAD(P)-dependent oxidoreductase [Candidatus Acidoferrum sp.]|nr:SDR family NAD(P)-dependent oxidoreductase [Candidatus Acidoferrum sp.]